MSFDTEVVKDGRGILVRIDVSEDDFANIAQRWSTRGFWSELTGPQPSPRIVRVEPVSKALGEDRSFTQTRCDVTLANTDGALDGLIDEWATTLTLKAKLYVGVYAVLETPDAAPVSVFDWKQLGEYQLDGMPRRTASTVSMGFQSRLGAALRTPSLEDWYEQDDECPYHWLNADDLEALQASAAWKTRLPLSFGDEAMPVIVPAVSATTSNNRGGGGLTNDSSFTDPVDKFFDNMAWPLCATSESSLDGHDGELWIQQVPDEPDHNYVSQDGDTYAVPKNIYINVTPGQLWNIWAERISGPIEVDGVTWYIRFLLVSVLGLDNFIISRTLYADYVDTTDWFFGDSRWFNATPGSYGPGGTFTAAVQATLEAGIGTLVVDAVAKGFGNQSHVQDSDAVPHVVDILRDVASYGLVPSLDATMASAAEAATSGIDNYLEGWLRIEAGTSSAVGGEGEDVLDDDGFAAILSGFAQSVDLDVFHTWGGELGVLADAVFDGDAEDLVRFAPQDIGDVSDGIASRQQRGAFYNRITGDAADFSELVGAIFGQPLYGPWDNPSASPTVMQRVLVRRLLPTWAPRRLLTKQSPWQFRWGVQSQARRRVAFSTGLKGLLLELGQFFCLDWVRGTSATAVYDGTVFVVVGLAVDLEACEVRVSAVEALLP